MSFLHPEFLYFMLPVLGILFSMLLTQQELTESFFSAEVLKKLYVDVDQFSTKTRNIFYLLMFFFLILALASPVIERGHALTSVEDDTFYIAIESGQNNFNGARKSAKEVIDLLQGVSIGLIVFGEESYLVSPPTKDHALLEEYIMTLESNLTGETSYAVLMDAVDLLMSDRKVKQLVVLGDVNITSLQNVANQKGIVLFNKDNIHVSGEKSEEKSIYFYLFLIPIALTMLMLMIATSSFHRGESHYVPSILFLVLLGSGFKPLSAELLSYQLLESAERAYASGEYERSAKAFKSYGMKMESKEAIYNAANSLYKAGDYAKALALYRSIHFVEADKNHALYHNLGNTLVAFGTEKDLYEAIAMYEKALRFKDMDETQENLQGLKSYLEEHSCREKKPLSTTVQEKTKRLEKKSIEVVENSRGYARASYYKIESSN